jgi:hypothetical protein
MVSSSSVVTINYKGESAELSSTYKKNHVLGGTPLFKGFIR